MLITKVSPETGKENTMDIDLSDSDYRKMKKGDYSFLPTYKLTVYQAQFLLFGFMPGEGEKTEEELEGLLDEDTKALSSKDRERIIEQRQDEDEENEFDESDRWDLDLNED